MRLSAFILLFILTSSLSAASGLGVESGDAVSVGRIHQAQLKDYTVAHECSDDLAAEVVQTSTSTTASARALRKLHESKLRTYNETPDGHSTIYFVSEQIRRAKYTGSVLLGDRIFIPVCICVKFSILRI